MTAWRNKPSTSAHRHRDVVELYAPSWRSPSGDGIAVVGQVTPIGGNRRASLDSDMAFVVLDRGGAMIKATRDGHAGSNVGTAVIATSDGFVVAGHAGGNFYDGAVWRMGANGEYVPRRAYSTFAGSVTSSHARSMPLLRLAFPLLFVPA